MLRSPDYPNPVVPEESEAVEKIETPKDIIHSEMNEMLRNIRKRYEGAAGIIVKLDLGSFPPRMLDALQQSGILVTEDTAAKILKIYSPGAAQHEFSMQTKARSAIENSAVEDTARIPKPLFYSEFTVDSDVADNLRSQNINLNDSNKVEMLLMDWIPGEDLMTQMYKKVLEFFPNHPALPDNPDDFQQLRFSASIVLGLEAPNLNVITAEQKESNEAITYRRNVERILRFLAGKNQEINPKIASELEKCVQTLHQNGVWHNDIHERNVVVVGDAFEKGEEAQIEAYLIDFGAATSTAQERKVSDSDLIQNLKKSSQITPSLEVKLKSIEQEIITSPRFLSTFAMVEVAAKKTPISGIEAAYALFPDDDGYKTIIACNQLLQNNLVTKQNVKEKIGEILDRRNDKRFAKRKNLKDYIETLN